MLLNYTRTGKAFWNCASRFPFAPTADMTAQCSTWYFSLSRTFHSIRLKLTRTDTPAESRGTDRLLLGLPDRCASPQWLRVYLIILVLSSIDIPCYFPGAHRDC